MHTDYTLRKTYNITGNGTVTIPGRWVLVSVNINQKGGSGNTIAIYDDAGAATPANRKATIDTTSIVSSLDQEYPMFNGIYAVVGGGTTPDITLVYEPLLN